jgi:hypothetical protein
MICGRCFAALSTVLAELPARWRDGLSGRTGTNDDGRIPELLAEAKRVFEPSAADCVPRRPSM